MNNRKKSGAGWAIVLAALVIFVTAGAVRILFYIDEEHSYAIRPTLIVLLVLILLLMMVRGNLETRNRLKSGVLRRIDGMTGYDFERWCAEYLSRRGFSEVIVTKASNDFGVDIVARQGDEYYAIQCKRCAYPVSNKAVQEVYTGKRMYDCTKAAVITNSYFTDAAKKTAERVEVILWDRDWLEYNALRLD